MPEIKIQHVVSVSSEDKNFPAENLVKGGSFKKWKCLAGEKQPAAVVLQFEKATEIKQIDIGNEGSAFIEVLVGKSSSLDCDYEVILASSSFMSPVESRASQNLNRVRIFGSDQLSHAVLDKKWDRVKVICTQPFNKSVQYGLSFIKFHSSPAPVSTEEDETKNKQQTSSDVQLGGFKLKSDSESSPALIRAGSLFEKSKMKQDQPSVSTTGAAAIRAASRQAEQAAASNSSATSNGGKNETQIDVRKRATEKSSNTALPPKKPKSDETNREKSVASTSKVPFSNLMKGVVFVLSGFQNPERSNLRDKAVEMGAVYKPDWGKGCTHLVCAFVNTPKYDQVAGHGCIVQKSWITDCHAQKKLLPWRNYRLGKAPSPPASDSDADDEQPKKKSSSSETKTSTANKGHSSSDNGSKKPTEASGEPSAASQDTVKMDSDEEWDPLENNKDVESECDTEEEVRRFEEKQARSEASSSSSKPSTSTKPSTSKSKNADIYDVSTDEETADNGKISREGQRNELPELPSFFSGKTFLLYGKLNDRRAVVRYITAYDGQLVDYMGDNVKYVITDSRWDETFDEALKDNPDLIFVRSSWIMACHKAQVLVPPNKYSVAAE